MAEQSAIEWTDSTFNPWIGCTKVGPGCDHCYAEKRMDQRLHVVNWGAGNPRKRTSVANWKLPMKWNAKPFYECSACGWRGDDPLPSGIDGVHSCPADSLGCQAVVRPARRRVFCASLADWLDNDVPIEWLCDLLELIRKTPNLDWLLLTKRIGNWRARLTVACDCGQASIALMNWLNDWMDGAMPASVWLGATIVNQLEAGRDIPKLLKIPARIRFLSMEPLLGPVDLDLRCDFDCDEQILVHREGRGHLTESGEGIHWVIAGGESGPGARPMHPDWSWSLRDQCAAAGVAFLHKQNGEFAPLNAIYVDGEQAICTTAPKHVFDDGTVVYRVGKKAAGRLLDGVEHNGFPVVSP